MNNSETLPPSRVPPPLRPGAVIGVIAPAGQIRDTEAFARGIALIGEMGFVPKFPRDLWPGKGYLADNDRQRAEEFNRMWADPEVAALLALRGGYGCLRMAGMIDLDLIRRQAKALIGFSDLTVLHTSLAQQTGLVSFHGPVLSSLANSDRASLERLHHCLTGNWQAPLEEKGVEILRGGDTVSGRLLGGNLSTLLTLLATPLEPDLRGCILFLEDVGEPLYRLDRMLTQLALAGKFNDLAGIILGDFSLGSEMEPLTRLRHHEAIWERSLELTAAAGVPVWGGFPIGHGSCNLTLPHGAMAVMDSRKGRLSFS